MMVILLGSVAAFGQLGGAGQLGTFKFPDPVIELTGKEAFQSNGQLYIRYKLRVKNANSYTDGLFSSSPELPACGQNNNASRTWVTIHEAGSNDKLNTFCAFNSTGNLEQLWFAVKQGDAPNCVYVTLNDRKLNRNYTSKKVCMSVSIQPIRRADLKVEQFQFAPTNNKALRVKVTNVGNATAAASTLRLTVRKINGIAVGRTFDVAVSSLTPGQSDWVLIQAASILPLKVSLQDTTFRLNADFLNAVGESNEANNEVWHNL